MQADLAARWQAYPRKKVNLPGQRKPVWLRFVVRHGAVAAADERWLLAVDWPLLQQVDFHQYDPAAQRWSAPVQGGLDRPAAQKASRDPTIVFPVDLKPGKATVVLVRAQSDNMLVVPLALWNERAWQAHRYDYGVAMGVLFGILGVMLFYNLSLYVFTGEPSFRSYTVYLLAIVGYELAMTGFGPLFLWGGNEWLNHRGHAFFACASFLTATIFFRRFLDLKHAAPHLNRLSLALVGFWGGLMAIAVFPMPIWASLALGIGSIVVGFAGIYTAAYLTLRGIVAARYLLVAWATIEVATFVTTLVGMGVIEAPGWEHAQHVGFVIETVLLSVALADRIKRERESKEAAERESLELARKVEVERDEKIRAQAHALEVQRQANEELELRVIDRTAELKRAMEKVELANRELARLSVTDALTKVHNRRYFDEAIRKEYERSARSGTPLAMMLIDIDHFKRINDSVGHLAGDECLKLVATALAACVGRSNDLVARYGGEEFAVVLPGTEHTQALEVAERIRQAVQDIQFIYRGQRIPVSVSLGVVARVADVGRALPDFISEADEALYAAKEAGRNRVMLAAA
jgi:diguanylate cyclase